MPQTSKTFDIHVALRHTCTVRKSTLSLRSFSTHCVLAMDIRVAIGKEYRYIEAVWKPLNIYPPFISDGTLL